MVLEMLQTLREESNQRFQVVEDSLANMSNLVQSQHEVLLRHFRMQVQLHEAERQKEEEHTGESGGDAPAEDASAGLIETLAELDLEVCDTTPRSRIANLVFYYWNA